MDRARAAQILGVGLTASRDQVRDAFRNRAREVHPDSGRGDAAAMVELNAAYEVLNSRREPDWEFAAPVSTGQWTRSDEPQFDDAFGPSSSGHKLLRWFAIILAVAGAVMTTVVFIAAIGYDWSLSP